jgi:all-trans-nonaprenyl-diphosphate synthase
VVRAVLTPSRPEATSTVHPAAAAVVLPPPAPVKPASLLSRIVEPVGEDMEQMNRNLRSIVGDRHPMLMAAADQIFGAGGKKLRPMIVFLVARATAHMAGLE